MAIGTQVKIDLYGCDPGELNDRGYIVLSLVEAALAAKGTILHSFSHQFTPHGVTGILALAESHIAVHTWLETGFAAFDIFTCGPMDAHVAKDIILKLFKHDFADVDIVPRGTKW